MKNVHVYYFVAATIFGVAAIIGFVKALGAPAVVGALLCISFLLAGIHYRRKNRRNL